MRDIHQEDNTSLPDNNTGTVFIRIAVPELKNQKCLQFQLEDTVWQAKQRVLAAFAKDLRDALNYGLYMPPMNGRAGKFLEEERLLKEYPLQGPIGFLEFKYKKRVYKMMQLNPRKLKQLHSKSNLKHFLEYVRAGNVEKINKITNKGLDPNFHDQDNGETPLTVAVTLVRDKCREVILSLISGGAHVDFRNRSGLTAMHRAAIVGNAEAIKTLLDLGASPDYKDPRGLTPLYYSVSNDTSQLCTEMLLHERALVGTHDDQGWCEIHQACRYGRVQHLEHLLFYGAELDVQNATGNTPLHICAAYNQEGCARVLLFRGADRSILNYSNQTAYQVAVISSNMDLADLIKNHKDEDVVPIREMPKYSNRRKTGSLTPSMRSLMRSRSDPRLHASVLEEQMLLAATSHHNLTTLGDFYDTASYPSYPSYASNISSHGYSSDSPCSLSISSASSAPMLGMTDQGLLEGRTMDGREGCFPPGHVGEVRLHKAGSVGDLMDGDVLTVHRNTLAALIQTERAYAPRTVVLHKSPEGYGFVLRGAKSHTHVGNLNFQPTPEFPALQYLDSVDEESQAERAGLLSGDYILEINGENVVRASHERVVQLIRASGNDLVLKVVTVRPAMEQYASSADWFRHQDGSMTLPPRKKQAPLPPRRDPQTSLSYSKATSKSMSEGLAEIEKLDQTIAEFDQQGTARRHSVHAVDSVVPSAADQKIASVKATHAMKRMSVVDMEPADGSASPTVPLKPAASDPRTGAVSKMSPSELRIKKYHKKNGSNTMERSKSTPDLADTELGTPDIVVQERGYGMPEGPGSGRNPQDRMSATWSKSHSVYVPVVPGMAAFEPKGDQSRVGVAGGDKSSSGLASPELPSRAPVPKRKAPQAPPKGEMVLISTNSGGAQSIMYANIAEEIAARQKSPYESSFRPGTNAQLTDNPSVMTQSLEQAKLQHRKSASMGNIDPSILSSDSSTHSSRGGVSFAEDRVYETAQTFIKKHPNARLLVTADVHGGGFARNAGHHPTDKAFYEPEPDYDDSDEDKTGSSSYTIGSLSTRTSGAIPVSSATSHTSTAASQNSSTPITVIAVGKDAVRQTGGTEKQYTVKSDIPAAPRSAVSQMDAAVAGSASSSRPSSVQPSPVLGRDRSKEAHQNEAGSSMVYVHHQSDETAQRFAHAAQPPPLPSQPPPSLPSQSPPPLPSSQAPQLPSSHHPDTPPPPPPPPPPPLANPPLLLPGNASPEKRAHPSKSSDGSSLPPHPVPASDIMAAVALRKVRLETEGPRLMDRPASAVVNPTQSAADRYQEALKAAIAKRKTILESSSDSTVVEGIEAKLQKNRKLQSAKHFVSSDPLRKGKKSDDGENPAEDASSKTIQANASKSGISEGKLEVKPQVMDVAANVKPKAATESFVKPKEIMHKPAPGKQIASTVPVSTLPAAKDATVTVAAKRSPEISVKSKTFTTSAAQNEALVSSVKVAVPEVAPTTKPATPPATHATKLATSTTKITTAPATSKGSNTTPVSKTGTINSSDFLALAERARQEYLQKVGASKAETKPSTDGSGSSNMPKLISASSAGSKSHHAVAVNTQSVKGGDQPAKISIKDKIANFQDGSKVKVVEVVGVTDDHSHTEASLSNGTIKRKVANGKNHEDQGVVAPPSAFGDSDKHHVTQLEIIPPPPSFGLESIDSYAGDQSSSAFGDDAASFVSSVSSLSTLSSEHGDSKSYHQYEDIVAPPPPPEFGDEAMASTNPAGEDIAGTFIPPPVQFSGQGQGYQAKAVEQWSCDDVLAWLDSVDMGQYKPSFAQNKVDGHRLQALQRNDYPDLGVALVGHRMALQRAITRLLLQNNPSS